MNYLLYGHGGAYNHGAEAILQTTIRGIRQQDQSASVLLSSHFPEQDQAFGIAASRFLERNREAAEREKREMAPGRYDREIYRTTIEAMSEGMIALSVGGDNYCYPAWHRWRCIHEEARRRKIPDILWSCSINPEAMEEEMLRTLASHSLITARESLTFQALQERGLHNAVLCADVAFLLEPKETVLPDGFVRGQTVAINVSPLVMRREAKTGIVKQAMLSLMDGILEKTGLQLALIPHVVMPMDNDYAALCELAEHYRGTRYQNRICLCSDRLSAAEYKYLISQCRYGVFARTHASIAAYSTGVPNLVLGYSVKARGIAKDMGAERFVLDVAGLNRVDRLRIGFEELQQEEKRLRQLFLERTVKMKELAKKPFSYLREIAHFSA